MAIKDIDRYSILRGLTPTERNITIWGITHQSYNRYIALRGKTHIQVDRGGILDGKDFFDRDFIVDTKPQIELGCILDTIEPPEIFIRYDFTEDEITDLSITSGSLINDITVQYVYDFVERKPRAAITKHNPLSKLLYGESKKTLELRMIQQTRQAEKIADAILFTSSIPEIKCSFKHNLKSLYIEVGDIVSITHPAGLGDNGWQKALATVSKKRIIGIEIEYELTMKPSNNLYRSELLTLSQTAGAGREGITVTYEHGVATIYVYANVQGYPPVEGAEVTISGVTKVTDRNGQVRFNLEPGTYTAYIRASGYEDAEVTFTV